MKYFLSIFLFLIVTHSWAQPHGGPTHSHQEEEEQALEEAEEIESSYTPLDNSQVTSNPQLQGLVFIGVQSATNQAIQDGSLPEGNYQVSQIISAAQNQDDYRFEVEVIDGQGNTAEILFFITFDSSAGTTEVTSYEVLGNEGGETTDELGESTEVGEGEFGEVPEVGELSEGEEQTQTEDGFVILDPSVAQTDTEIAGILNVGVQEVVEQAMNNGSLYYSSSYDLVEVYSVQQNIANPDEYRFEVSVRDTSFNTVRMTFDLVYDESSETVEILSWGYPNSIIPDNGEEENSTLDEIPAGYQEVEFNLNDPTTLVYQIQKAALQVVVATGVLEGTIPSYGYEPTNIRSVSTKLEEGKLYYRFDLDAADGGGNTARFTYVVSYDPATSTTKLEETQITNIVRAL